MSLILAVEDPTRRLLGYALSQYVRIAAHLKILESTSFGTRPDGIWGGPPWTTRQTGWCAVHHASRAEDFSWRTTLLYVALPKVRLRANDLTYILTLTSQW